MIDHQATAHELERIARTTFNLAKIVGTAGALKTAQHSKDHLLGLADWHLAQHAKQQVALNLAKHLP